MTTHDDPRIEHHLASTYDAKFYDGLAGDVRSSAEVVVPIVVDLVQPLSVVDVGCGRGTWLDVFRGHGVGDVVGVDGPHIAPEDLEIPLEAFVRHDLREPLDLGRRFDLATSLEVAEHLPAEMAEQFVGELVAHAPAVLFSAAVPRQGGKGHVNERWPSYWSGLFEELGFVPIDVVRPAVWRDARVAFWYAQNVVLYVDPRQLPQVVTRASAPVGTPLDLVHPALHLRERDSTERRRDPPSLSRVLRDLPGAAARAMRTRAGRAGGRSK